jgi:hypothetical protein
MISVMDIFRILIALFIILLYEIHGEYGEYGEEYFVYFVNDSTKGGKLMKKLVLIIAMGMFLAGCAGVKQSEYMEHSSHYKTWSHLGFSWWGFKNVTEKAADTSKAEKWWGISYARH